MKTKNYTKKILHQLVLGAEIYMERTKNFEPVLHQSK